MKLLVLDPDFYKSALLMDNKKRCFNHVIVCEKMLKIFSQQSTNNFVTVPNYKVWVNHQEALKLYYNCLLRVAKEIHHYNTKYDYFKIDKDKLTFPPFTELTFKSHQAFCLNLDFELYYPKFGEKVRNFNGGILIWEYDLNKNGEVMKVAEDFNGMFNQEKFIKNINIPIKTNYNLIEINKENL